MKILFVTSVVMLLVACGSNSSNPIIGTTKRVGNIKVAEKDFPNRMNWDEAVAACAGLGGDWRLPTKEELNEIYLNRYLIGGFTKSSTNIYWSSTEYKDYNFINAWCQDFSTGSQVNLAGKNYPCYVRAVRMALNAN